MHQFTFHCLVCRDRLANRPLSDHDDRHSRKYPLRLDANACAMNDVMSGLHAIHGRVRGYDVYGVQMNAANAADALDADLGWDVCIFRKRSGFHRRNVDDTGYCMTEVLLLFSVVELIVDLN